VIGAPWIYSEELEPRVLALLGELAAARSIVLDDGPAASATGEPLDRGTVQVRNEARVRVRELKKELRDILSGVG